MIIRAQSPTRIDLGGGTLDLWPLFNFHPGSHTINLAIDIMTESELIPRKDKSILIESEDVNFSKEYPNLSELLSDSAPEVSLLREIVRFYEPQKGFELTTSSQSPVGGGLGGSSSLTISILKTFNYWLKRKYSPSEMVTIAHNIEASILGVPTGTQDYYPPLLGGLNILSYGPWGCSAKTLKSDLNWVKKRWFLIYTGKPHHSGLNNWQIMVERVNKNPKITSALTEICKISQEIRDTCLEGAWDELDELFDREYEARKQLSGVFVTPEIVKLREFVLSKGARSLKICGAGGGGCVLISCDTETQRSGIMGQCKKSGYHVLEFEPVAKVKAMSKSR